MATAASSARATSMRPAPMADRFVLSPREAAAALNLGLTKLYQEIAAGRLEALKSGKRTLIPTSACHAYIASLPPVELTARALSERVLSELGAAGSKQAVARILNEHRDAIASLPPTLRERVLAAAEDIITEKFDRGS